VIRHPATSRPPPAKKKAASTVEHKAAAPGDLVPREKPKIITPHRREVEGRGV
jgi:hypothetical protein